MRSFTLILDDENFDEPRRIEFWADDAYTVFPILEREGTGTMAILLEGEKRLGALRRSEIGFWHVAP